MTMTTEEARDELICCIEASASETATSAAAYEYDRRLGMEALAVVQASSVRAAIEYIRDGARTYGEEIAMVKLEEFAKALEENNE